VLRGQPRCVSLGIPERLAAETTTSCKVPLPRLGEVSQFAAGKAAFLAVIHRNVQLDQERCEPRTHGLPTANGQSSSPPSYGAIPTQSDGASTE
jgi:hypothetical protein